jgi:hypothetical protein
VGAGSKDNILAIQPSQLGNPQSRLDSDEEKCSIAAPNPICEVRYSKQSVNLFPVEELDRSSFVAFVWYRQYSLAMPCMGRFLQGHVLEERVNRCQARIPSASAVFANAFQVFEEISKKGRVEIFDHQL